MRKYIWIGLISLLACESKVELGKVEDFQIPNLSEASLPYLVKGGDGFLYFSWIEKRDSNWVDFKYSKLENETWTEPELIASGNDWFVNWADYPMMAVDFQGNMIGHYLAKSDSGTYSYDVNLVLKPKGANSWSDAIIPHKDGTPTEHGFVTMLAKNDGSFLISWLDGRNTGGGHGDHGEGGAMTIRTAEINTEGKISNKSELDNRVCDCCQTTGAMTPSGALFAFRDRSDSETRDISFVSNNGGSWSNSEPVANDNWEIFGCPVNGPRMAAFDNSTAIAWYTAANDQPMVKVAFMTGGKFDTPIIIDDSEPMGRVDIVMINSETAIVSWLDTQGKNSSIKCRLVKKDSTLGDPITISNTNKSRASGFPQLEVINDEVIFAWTNLQDSVRGISMRRLMIQ